MTHPQGIRRIGGAICLAFCSLVAVEPLGAASTTLVTVAMSVPNEPAKGGTYPAISADGRFIAFASRGANLVADDTNGQQDVFVYDRQSSTTTRVSVDSAGVQANGASSTPSISADGRFVAFQSSATNLTAGGAGPEWRVFVHDRQSGTTLEASVDSSGVPGNENSSVPSISSDGRFLVFSSVSSNLVLGDANGHSDVFVRDLVNGVTSRVSVNSAGTEADGVSSGCSISADGRYVAFMSDATNLVAGDANGFYDAFIRDRVTGSTSRISVSSAGVEGSASSYCATASISGDGRFVTFYSPASSLVAGDTNENWDVFVRDRLASMTFRVSVSSLGEQANSWNYLSSISADGSSIVFQSAASNLIAGDALGFIDVFVHDLQTGITSRASLNSDDVESNSSSNYYLDAPVLSHDGRFVAFTSVGSNLVAGDTNESEDIFLRDRQMGTTERLPDSIPQPPGGGALVGDAPTGNRKQSLSESGRRVAFDSAATNLVSGDENGFRDVFLRDLDSATTQRISLDSAGLEADGESSEPSISSDGRFVAFSSFASDLVATDTNGLQDVFVRDTEDATTTRVSIDSGGLQSDGASFSPSISSDGRFVAFVSMGTNLVDGASNGTSQIYVRDRVAATTTRVSIDNAGAAGNLSSLAPYISSDGRFVAFESYSDSLVAGDVNSAADVFVRDRQTGSTTLESVFGADQQIFDNSTSPSISDDGRFVAFLQKPEGCGHPCVPMQRVLLRDRQAATTHVISDTWQIGYLPADSPILSRSGRFIAFEQLGRVILRDLQGANEWNGGQLLAGGAPSITSDGRYIAFSSDSTVFVPGVDLAGFQDLFVHDRDPIFVDGFYDGNLLLWSATLP